ncbi:MAG: ribonuclease HI family protein [Thermodesulfobacteriota bacterium]
MYIEIFVDGASRGNPGEAGAGVVILDSEGNVIKKTSRYLGVTTNNVAEYNALIIALQEAVNCNGKRLKIYSDSELMVKQIKGEYRVRNTNLRGFYQKALRLLREFEDHDIIHIKRKFNKEADSLANKAIDELS